MKHIDVLSIGETLIDLISDTQHGQTHLPMGTKHMAWSAAAGVLAHQAVWHGITPWPL